MTRRRGALALAVAVTLAPSCGKHEVPVTPDTDHGKGAPSDAALDSPDPRTDAAVVALLRTPRDARKLLSPEASRDLSLLGPRAIPALVRALRRGDERLRWSAAIALREINREPWAQLTIVDGELSVPGPQIEDSVSPLIEALSDPSPDVRVEAASTLGLFGTISEPAVPALLDAIRSGSDALRLAAMEAAGKIGPGGRPAVPFLRRALKDEREEFRAAAVIALGRIRDGAEEAVPEIAALLADRNPEIRRCTCMSLGKFGPAAKSEMGHLCRAMEDEVVEVRYMAALALSRFGPDAPEAVSALRRALRDPSERVRRRSAQSLGTYGEAAEPAITDLVEVVKTDRAVLQAAAWGLSRMGPKAATALAEAYSSGDESIRLAVATAFAALAARGEPSVLPALVARLGEPSDAVRAKLVEALVAIGTPAIPVLEGARVQPGVDETFRRVALSAEEEIRRRQARRDASQGR